MLDFDALQFDHSYLPDREVLESANSFLASIVTPMYIDGEGELTARVRSIKMADTDAATDKGRSCPVGDILLYLESEAWSYSRRLWKKELCPKHTLDTLYCTVQRVVIWRSVLLKNEIDAQFGIADWEEVDVDGGSIPDDALQTYFEVLESDWWNLAAEYSEAGCPSLKTLDPRVRKLAIQALRRARGGYVR